MLWLEREGRWRLLRDRPHRRQRRRLRETFSDYIAGARKANGRSVRTTAGSAPKRGNSEELAKIRDWANANGHEVSSRGRISQAVRRRARRRTQTPPRHGTRARAG
ncbi:histone-like nucleoid-structuring protein Lsr2 [Curtobacterium flaccumfaciens]|nr:histone-like nucleoid-structuring protein Lsr2 [Curtobacterium flaccumfaciens]